jgi:osmotically-inducible protein OsmY
MALVMSTAAAAAARSNLDLFKDVQRQVLGYAFFTVFDDVNIDIEDHGLVILTGRVTMPHKKNGIAERVAAVDGVTEVQNEITVLRVSGFDNELRYRVARAIYGNPNFWHYAAQVNPPVHIVVEGGHVTLTGVVDSETDRALARVLANQFGAFSVTDELRLPDEVTQELEAIG